MARAAQRARSLRGRFSGRRSRRSPHSQTGVKKMKRNQSKMCRTSLKGSQKHTTERTAHTAVRAPVFMGCGLWFVRSVVVGQVD